jgi:SAM-dependent methyltransferase
MVVDALDEQLLSLLRCVRDDCGAPLSVPGESSNGGARCTACGVSYPDRGGFLDLTVGYGPSLAQGLMDSPAVASIYETVLWRRTHTWLSGVGLDREMSTVLEWMAPFPDAPVVDLGCGPGLYARRLARESARTLVVGVDRSEAMLRRALVLARRAGIENLRLVRADLSRLPFASRAFARAHAGGVLHLLPDAGTALAEIARVLEGGGTFTAMTVRAARGPVGWIQRHAAQRGTACFWSPEQYRASLAGLGLENFEWRSHGLMLLCRAVRADRPPLPQLGYSLSATTGSTSAALRAGR